MRKLIAIVCNSTNQDLVQYFLANINALKSLEIDTRSIILTNKRNVQHLGDQSNIYISSLTKSAFLDKMLFIDYFMALYNLSLIIIYRIKCIHFTTSHVSNLFLAIPAKLMKINLIFTLHDLVPHPGKKATLIGLYNKLIIKSLADEIITFSASHNLYERYKKNFTQLPLSGFEQESVVPKAGNKTILFFGRIEPYKGLQNLLDIAQMAIKETPQYQFIIAGSGVSDQMEKLKSLSNVQIINRYIEKYEMESLFNLATFVLIPYDSATQSGVVVLSYSYATPVIAYDVGALSEYVNKKTGFLVSYKNNERILEIIKNIDEEEVLQLSSNIIEVFKSTYSYNAATNYYRVYYNEIFAKYRIIR